MSNVIDKGEQTAYQRWEMASFDEGHTKQSRPNPTQNEHEKNQLKIKTEAYAIGYKEGFAQGYEEGEKAGYTEIQDKMRIEVQESILHIEKLGQNYANSLSQVHTEVSVELLNLAIELAEKMLLVQFEINEEAIINIVKESITNIPIVHQPAQIFLHPLDAEIIEKNLSKTLRPDGWKLITDTQISRGGCKIETAHNIIDATKESRWERLTQALTSSSPLSSIESE